MVSPVSGDEATSGGSALVLLTGGIAGVAGADSGAGFGAEVLHPVKSARDSAVAAAAAASVVRLSKNIKSLVSHPIVTNKFQNRREFELLKNRSPEILGA